MAICNTKTITYHLFEMFMSVLLQEKMCLRLCYFDRLLLLFTEIMVAILRKIKIYSKKTNNKKNNL